jgi:hypothetical protein
MENNIGLTTPSSYLGISTATSSVWNIYLGIILPGKSILEMHHPIILLSTYLPWQVSFLEKSSYHHPPAVSGLLRPFHGPPETNAICFSARHRVQGSPNGN